MTGAACGPAFPASRPGGVAAGALSAFESVSHPSAFSPFGVKASPLTDTPVVGNGCAGAVSGSATGTGGSPQPAESGRFASPLRTHDSLRGSTRSLAFSDVAEIGTDVFVFAGFTYGTGGGWIPARIQIERASTMRGWFIRNRTIVALPVGVKPRRLCPLCIHAICSGQLWILGLNRGTVSPVSGSGAEVA
jgi:hypothetical protein